MCIVISVRKNNGNFSRFCVQHDECEQTIQILISLFQDGKCNKNLKD